MKIDFTTNRYNFVTHIWPPACYFPVFAIKRHSVIQLFRPVLVNRILVNHVVTLDFRRLHFLGAL